MKRVLILVVLIICLVMPTAFAKLNDIRTVSSYSTTAYNTNVNVTMIKSHPGGQTSISITFHPTEEIYFAQDKNASDGCRIMTNFGGFSGLDMMSRHNSFEGRIESSLYMKYLPSKLEYQLSQASSVTISCPMVVYHGHNPNPKYGTVTLDDAIDSFNFSVTLPDDIVYEWRYLAGK